MAIRLTTPPPITTIVRRRSIPSLSAAVFAALLLVGCSTEPRLQVDEGQIFSLADSDTVNDAIPPIVDGRPLPLPRRQTEPLFVTLGAEDIDPSAAQAIRIELSRRLVSGVGASRVNAYVHGKPMTLKTFAIGISGLSVMGRRRPTAGQVPGVAALGEGMGAISQAIGGSSSITVDLSIEIGDRTFHASGRGDYSSHPGVRAALWPFQNAVEDLWHQIVSAQDAAAARPRE